MSVRNPYYLLMRMEDKMEIELLHDGQQYRAFLTPAKVEEISTDGNKFVQLIEQLSNKENIQCSWQTQLDVVNPGASTSDTSSKSTKNETNFKWTHESIKLLIDLRLGMESQFNSPICKKIKLWGDIAKAMNEVGKYNISGNDCYAKYRNLLQTYRHNKEKKQKTGEGKVTWEFFETFDLVLGNKASVCLPNNTLSISIEVINKDSEIRNENETENKVAEVRKEVRKKRKEVSVSQYLYLKCEKDEERYREKKRLKEMEISAINNLADAICSTVPAKERVQENYAKKECLLFGQQKECDDC